MVSESPAGFEIPSLLPFPGGLESMAYLPRIAIGTAQPGAHAQPMALGLMEAFRRAGVLTQSFFSRAQFPRYQGELSITGLSPRYLDSWLMTPRLCCALFAHGAGSADLAVVLGEFRRDLGRPPVGGQLESLCRWLDLPRLVVLDVSQLAHCGRPEIPGKTAGLFLDGVSDESHFARLATDLEAIHRIPVLGAMSRTQEIRAALKNVASGDRVPVDLCRELGDRVSRWWRPKEILRLATQRNLPDPDPSWLIGTSRRRRSLSVAIAYDEAFNCYFPDTLDLLELRGASVVGFSPLRDEQLPSQSDVVCFGCGHPERYAAALSENHCMIASLRSHLCSGRRIYGEGGGAAYLCGQMETPGGEFRRMAGILPAIARLRRTPAVPEPVKVTLAQSTWLGGKGAVLGGYRNPYWTIDPLDRSWVLSDSPYSGANLIGNSQSLGSLIHLDFAADASSLDRFFYPECSAQASINFPAAFLPH